MTPLEHPDEQKLFSVLFVCTANVCRSPMAEVLLKDMLATHPEIETYRVESAGVAALDGFRASENSRLVMEERGLDLTRHRSQSIRAELLEDFNLILVMEETHRKLLVQEFPRFAERIYLLTEMVGEKGDVDDPYGSVLTAYRVTAEEIQQLLQDGFDIIHRKAIR